VKCVKPEVVVEVSAPNNGTTIVEYDKNGNIIKRGVRNLDEVDQAPIILDETG